MVSVIIPYRNAEKWIGRCAGSLKRQGGDFEFLFVNDGGEAEIPADDRFMFFDNEHAPGVSGARNTGLDHARGEWITFLDADDEMLPDAFKSFSDVSDGINQFNHLRRYRGSDKIVQKYPNSVGWYDIYNMPKCWCMVWNKLYRRELLDGVRFKEGLQFGEDELFNLECLARCKRIYNSATPTVLRYFDNRQSLSHSRTREKLLAQSAALEEYLAKCGDPDMRRLVRAVLAEHWGSKCYEKVFNG